MYKSIKAVMLIASFLAVLSCKRDITVTPSDYLNQLSTHRVVSEASVNNPTVDTKVVYYNSQLDSLQKYGFNVTAFNAVNKKMWNTTLAYNNSTFTSSEALWVKAGRMNFYASHPTSFSFNESREFINNTGSAWPLTFDPVVSVVKSEETNVVDFEFYHVASQIKMTVENNSDWDIRVHGELIGFYSWGNFKWQEPIDQSINAHLTAKKLPASCWSVSDQYFAAKAVGNTAGSVNGTPFMRGDRAQLLVTNVVPVIYDGHEIPSVLTGTTTYPTTRVRYHIYYQKDGIEQDEIVYDKEITDLIPGVCYTFNLDIRGDYEPSAMVTTSTVDAWTEFVTPIVVNPWETVKYNVALQSSNPSWGTVSGAGTIKSGDQVTIEAIPTEGYEFKRWSDGSTERVRTIVVTSDINLTALFAEKSTYDNLYLMFANEFQASKNNALIKQDDNHTWTATVTITKDNKGWTSDDLGFWIVSSTDYNYTAFYGNPGSNVLAKGDQNTYPQTLIVAQEGTYQFTFNDKTLEYTLTPEKSIDDYKSELQSLIDTYTSDDPNDYDYTKESLDAYNKALAEAKLALSSDSVEVVRSAIDNLKSAYKGLTTGSTDVELPDIG